MLALVPTLFRPTAEQIVLLTERYAALNDLPVTLVLAVQYTESTWGTNPNHLSPKDHGLMGLRVDKDTRPEYLGREAELLDLETNIRLGTEALVYWKRHHRRNCPRPLGAHPWVSHYQWGNRVGSSTTGRKVLATMQRLTVWKNKPRQ
jgi:hypothetical protein